MEMESKNSLLVCQVRAELVWDSMVSDTRVAYAVNKGSNVIITKTHQMCRKQISKVNIISISGSSIHTETINILFYNNMCLQLNFLWSDINLGFHWQNDTKFTVI